MAFRFLHRLQDSLKKTHTRILDHLRLTFTGHLIDPTFWDELVEILVMADVSLDLAEAIVNETRARAEKNLVKERALVLPLLLEVLTRNMNIAASPLHDQPPAVYFFVGVNGTGKTTTIAKMAYWFKQQGRRVMLCAADTFRAAAIEQLQTWAERLGVPCIHHQSGADPAAVLFDALSAYKARGVDFLLVDTAGRLHTKINLMKELEKMYRVARQQVPGAPHESFLILDATVGQNAFQQAKVFTESAPLSGIIITKLDGTAKGGAVLSIIHQLRLPVRFVGIGEKPTDFLPFDSESFAKALMGTPEELAEILAESTG